mgnify:CR=1 FL=1
MQGGDWKQLETRKLTKLERSMLEAAKTRHKEGIAAPKVSGEGFCSGLFEMSVSEKGKWAKHLSSNLLIKMYGFHSNPGP